MATLLELIGQHVGVLHQHPRESVATVFVGVRASRGGPTCNSGLQEEVRAVVVRDAVARGERTGGGGAQLGSWFPRAGMMVADIISSGCHPP